MLRIESIEPGSYAAELGLDPGDRVLAINQQQIDDLVDYYRSLNVEFLQLDVLRLDDEIWELEVEKDVDEDLGLQLEHPEPRQCGNNCVFCFVHQLPKGLRRSLYIKDEDYRFSYLYGSYITLTNLSEADYLRIVVQKLSPLYISVHATEDSLRRKLLGAKTPAILPLIERLTAAGIELHCQIVVCPGLNDGPALDQSISDLAQFYPKVASLAVVPVGLTKHRDNLPDLKKFTPFLAQQVLYQVEQHQDRFLAENGARFVFAADEFYVQADAAIPDLTTYEELSQLENGVGLIAQFRQQAAEVLLDVEPLPLARVSLVTAESFSTELRAFAERLSVRTDVELPVWSVNNDFFGDSVSVAGLITGKDLLLQLQGKELGQALLIPDVMLKADREIFLDDYSVSQLSDDLAVPVTVVESSPWGIFEGLEKLADNPVAIIHC